MSISYYGRVVASSFLSRCLGARTLLAALLLAGCAGPERPAAGEGGAPARSESAADTAEDARPVIVAFGDSLTSGQGVGRDETYPAFLQREIDRRGLAFRVVNEGVSGDTTAKALSRVASALAHEPAWVILGLGANDGLRGLPLADMERNLAQMVRLFSEGGARVLLAGMMLPRNYGPDYVGDFEAIYPRLAEDFGLPLIPFLLQDVAMVRELNNRDGIHPNSAGNEIIARNVADTFEGLVAATDPRAPD